VPHLDQIHFVREGQATAGGKEKFTGSQVTAFRTNTPTERVLVSCESIDVAAELTQYRGIYTDKHQERGNTVVNPF
jgi:hypothetical protein